MSAHSKSQPVLVLGASPRISLSIARSLQRRGIPVDIASFQPEERDISSRAIRAFHRLPARQKDPEGFAAAMLALVREQEYDLILAAGDPALAVLAELYDELSPLLHVGCPQPRAVERVLNKSLTLETAEQCGIRAPFSCRIATVEELHSVAPQLSFPVVVKPEKKGASTFPVFYYKTLSELRSALKSHNWGSVLLQEYCAGVGMGVEILIHNGECVARFQHRRLREAPATGGVAVLAVSEEIDPELFRSAMTLLRALEWEGVAMVEFRVDRETGATALMEVNGRFWGSVSLPIMAGVDFPFYYWQLFHGEQPRPPDPYRVGLRWRWFPGLLDRIQSILYRRGGVGRTRSKLHELLAAPADFSPFMKEALWSWSDPSPWFAEMNWAIRGFIHTAFGALFRKIVPRRVKSYSDICSRLTPESRRAYTDLRIRNALHMNSNNGRHMPRGTKSFLFVCYGNLMRSPMAEVMMKHVLAEGGISGMVVQSAGLHALPGREAHPWALAVSRELGMPLDLHRAQLVTPELVASSDAIFAMDFENLAELETRYHAAKRKIFMLSAYADGLQKDREIPDPYFEDIEGTRRCYSLLRNCIDNLVRDIARNMRLDTAPLRQEHSPRQ